MILACTSLVLGSCQITDKNDSAEITSDVLDNENPPVMTFEEEIYDFGEISMGSSVQYSFKFKNTGGSPLVIHSVKASCGCTVINKWPKEAIPPGGTGEIPVEMTPKGPGKQVKSVSIIANTRPATVKVSLTGTVIGPE